MGGISVMCWGVAAMRVGGVGGGGAAIRAGVRAGAGDRRAGEGEGRVTMEFEKGLCWGVPGGGPPAWLG